MKLRTERDGDIVVLDLQGELDAEGSTELEERCLYEQQEGARHLVIGLGGVGRITGPGLRVLLGLARSLPRAGGSLVLYALESAVEEALQVSGLAAAFETALDRASGLARSKQLQAMGGRPRAVSGAASEAKRAATEEKIDLAIELLGSSDPAGRD